MRSDNRANILFRYGIIILLILCLAVTILVKLFDTTVISADAWNERARRQLSKVTVIHPERGNILAADGSVLATNLRYYTAFIDYRSERFMEKRLLQAIDSIADSLALHFPRRDAAAWKRHLLEPMSMPKAKRPRAYTLLTNITYGELQLLRTFPFFDHPNPNRNGLTWEERKRRVNPYGNMARRSIGGVGATADNSEVHGISGLEKALDGYLYGTPGVARQVPMTRKMAAWADTPAVAGYDIHTTIDIKMQDIVETELNNRLEYVDADWGVAVLMDVHTGDIKAISNLEKNPRGSGYIEGMNRAAMGYEPGSVVKVLSMLIALEDGIVQSPRQTVVTGERWSYAGGRVITDTHAMPELTVAEVIELSSNIGMAKIITSRYDSHPGGFYSRIKDMGFLEPLDMGIAGAGVPRIDSIPTNRGGRIALSRMSYGYATEIPPLYTLALYNAIAADGAFVRPRLVRRIVGEGLDSVLPVTYIRPTICSPQTAAALRDMLRSVVWGKGTAQRLRDDDVPLAGKTGTCYMIHNGEYDKTRKRLTFCGYFPADNPQYSCIVLTANPRRNNFGASSTSGEVMLGIARKMYARGMLNNSSDYNAEAGTHTPTPPVYHASVHHPERAAALHEALSPGTSRATLRTPATAVPRGAVPDVRGLSVVEAVAILERAGYNTATRGAGHVSAQHPAPGTRAPLASRVTLTLNI